MFSSSSISYFIVLHGWLTCFDGVLGALVRPKPFHQGWGRLTQGKKNAIWNGQDNFFQDTALWLCLSADLKLTSHLKRNRASLFHFSSSYRIIGIFLLQQNHYKCNNPTNGIIRVSKAKQARKLAIPRKNKANNLILSIPEKTQQSKEARQGDWAKFQKGKREKNRKKL